MMTAPDQFAQSFDAIEIDRRRAPSPAAIDGALAACAQDGPGFYLVDDAGKRFVVDREFGVVSVRDEALLAVEHGQVHEVRLRVVESTGESYVLDLKLRVTGMVPQMVGAEDFGFGEEGVIHQLAPRPAPWTAFAAARSLQSKDTLATHGPYGALLAVTLPPTREHAAIGLGATLPLSAPAHAIWSL